tara:strand:- start:857 stop:1570 length:714 start_codon:yes stop_codon:yes gene_type:complete
MFFWRNTRQRNKKKLDKKIKKERKYIARLEAKLNKKKAIHKNICEIKEFDDMTDLPFDYHCYNRIYDNIDDAFLFAKKYFETKWPQYANNYSGPGTVEYFIFQKARKYHCSLSRLEAYLGFKYGFPTCYPTPDEYQNNLTVQEINEEFAAEKTRRFNQNRKQRIKRALQYRGLIKKTIYDKTINKWTKLYKGIIRKRQFEAKLWFEKQKNKILTESLDNYLRYIRQYQIESSQIYET